MSNALKYDRHVDLNDSSSIGRLSRWVTPGSRVLEFGPATGAMTRILSQGLNCEVTCIEIDPQYAEVSRQFCQRMIVGDLEKLDFAAELTAASFDYIIFADVLEHLRNPEQALRRAATYLKDDGAILASIPNIGHSGVILELMQGEFRYRKEGLLDETHLRFFTRRSVAELFAGTGYSIQQWERTVLDPEYSEFHQSLAGAPKPVRDFMTSLPDWNTYQFLVRAYRSGSEMARSLPVQGDFSAGLPIPETDVVQVFLDSGDGFREETSVSQRLQIREDIQSVRFQLEPSATAQRIRIDPVASAVFFSVSKIEITDRSGNVVWTWQEGEGLLGDRATLIAMHEIRIAGTSFFAAETLDPQIVINPPPDIKQFEISGLSIDIDSLPVKRLTTLTTAYDGVLAELDALSIQHAELRRYNDILQKETYQAQLEATQRNHEMHLLYTSNSWRLMAPIRKTSTLMRAGKDLLRSWKIKLKSKLRVGIARTVTGRRLLHQISRSSEDREYQTWFERHRLTDAQIAELSRAAGALCYRPLISIVLPVYEPNVSWLDDAIASVRRQAYPHWELCIADDCSKNPEIRSLLERHMREDSRIKVEFRAVNGHISEASNSALALAKGDFVALLDHDDLLSADALFEMVRELNKDPTIDMLYSNEDKIDHSGEHCQPTFKPQWSPDYFLSFMYIGHLSVYRRSLVNAVGGFRKGLEGSQDYDLALRFIERADKVRHVPKVLYHWRMHEDSVASNIHAKPYAFKSGHRALSEALERRKEPAVIESTRLPGIYRLRQKLESKPSVCVVITSGSESLLSGDVSGIVSRLQYADAQILLGGARVPARPRFPKYLCFEGDRFASREEVWRTALSVSKAEYILLIDSRVRPVSDDWFEEMLSQVTRRGVAAVGPKIIDQTAGTVVCAGYSIFGKKAASNFAGLGLAHPGYAARMYCLNNVSAISASCVLFHRDAIRGFLNLEYRYESPVARDIDVSFSLARTNGDRILLTPHAQVSMPSDSIKRLSDLSEHPGDWSMLEERFQLGSFSDPYYPRGLDAENLDFKIKLED